MAPPANSQFDLWPVEIPASLHQAYYERISNQAIWPLCHNVYRRPVHCEADWQAYRRVNQLFADAVLEAADNQPAVVFTQDYHLALLPRLLRRANPNLVLGHFWHIPWPAPELMQTLPWAEELIDGLLGNDVVAFHLAQHSRNFIAAADAVVRTAACCDDSVRYLNRPTRVRSVPISIDFEEHTSMAQSSEVSAAMEVWRARTGGVRYLGIGIDRCDYTKGIPERLTAVARLLESNPALRGQFSFVQVAVPSRSAIPAYAELRHEIEQKAADINARFGSDDWKPIILEQRNLPPTEMMALHRLATFCMVTPLHDGMNLVAKEFVASRFDNDGVLILSRFAGAAGELTTAVQVNPFSESSLVTNMVTALTMPKAERQARMCEARRVIATNNVYKWAGTLIQELGEIVGSRVHGRARADLLRHDLATMASLRA